MTPENNSQQGAKYHFGALFDVTDDMPCAYLKCGMDVLLRCHGNNKEELALHLSRIIDALNRESESSAFLKTNGPTLLTALRFFLQGEDNSVSRDLAALLTRQPK